MVVKQSSLNKKWYYRVGKVILMVLPWAILLILFLKGTLQIPKITQQNILDVIEKNLWYIGGTIIGYVLYIGILDALRRLVCYIGRGGYVNDTRKINTGTQAPAPRQQDNSLGFVFLLIIIILIAGGYYNQSSPSHSTSTSSSSNVKRNQCIPTGCGNLRLSSCTHKCYNTQSDCRLSASYQYGNCSSYTCRQCP